MSLLVVLNGSNYIIPETNEVGWGSNLDDFFVAIPAGVLQKTGGAFSLTAETDFGSSYGLKSLYFKSRTSNPASAGQVRLGNTDNISWRNATNNADLSLTVNSSNVLTFNSGALIISGNIVNADISASAAIALSKLAAVTASRALVSDGSGVITVSSATATELGYVSGVTSAIQTQLNTKIDTAGTGLSKTGTTLNLSTPVSVTNGGVGVSSLTAYSVLCGGTTSTGAVQSVSGIGSSGQVLTSNGAASLPTWQNVAGTGTVNSGTAGRLTLYATSTNAVSDTYVQNANNINVVIATHASLAATRTYTIPDSGASSSFVMSEGASTINGVKTLGNQLVTINGSSSTPAINFGGHSGIYTNGTDSFRVIVGGVDIFNADTNTFNISTRVLADSTNGSVSTPSYSFGGDADSGMYRIGANNIALATNGIKALEITSGQVVDAVVQLMGHGTSTNDSPPAGYIGEVIQSVVASVSVPASSLTYGDATSISLTAGDWLVSVTYSLIGNGATLTASFCGISTTSGNSTTGLVAGSNLVGSSDLKNTATLSGTATTWSIPSYHMQLASTTTVYLKHAGTYSAATPQANARITAVRIR